MSSRLVQARGQPSTTSRRPSSFPPFANLRRNPRRGRLDAIGWACHVETRLHRRTLRARHLVVRRPRGRTKPRAARRPHASCRCEHVEDLDHDRSPPAGSRRSAASLAGAAGRLPARRHSPSSHSIPSRVMLPPCRASEQRVRHRAHRSDARSPSPSRPGSAPMTGSISSCAAGAALMRSRYHAVGKCSVLRADAADVETVEPLRASPSPMISSVLPPPIPRPAGPHRSASYARHRGRSGALPRRRR